MSSVPVEVLLCSRYRNGGNRRNGWAFPTKITRLLKRECEGQTVLHLFGGLADFGLRLDIDRLVKPDVVGDAWLPPFAPKTFDVVILDPPYSRLNAQEKKPLFIHAGGIARRLVVWFHTIWMSSSFGLKLERGWLVSLGDEHYVRCLEFFRPSERLWAAPTKFLRGPAIKYNRWLIQPQGLPFPQPQLSQSAKK